MNSYLLVTHIPFSRNEQGEPVVDALWARDLIGLTKSVGPLRVAAPEVSSASLKTWGHNSSVLPESTGIQFRGFAQVRGKRDYWRWPTIRRVLREEVRNANLVHTSNFYPPYLGLAYAHDYAAKMGKPTVFVVAEDFPDILEWEWVRPSSGLEQWRRRRTLAAIDQRVRKSAATAALTFLHTPAVVDRYRLCARRSVAIRQPGFELEHVITADALQQRIESLKEDRPLRLACACRHVSLKGIDLLLRAIGLLKDRGVKVTTTLYGQGPETEQLKKLAGQLGIAGQVNMPGALSAGPELDHALQQADLFVMPHRSTDFGRAFFDAIAAALPVVAFRTPASAETVYDGLDGFLTPMDDIQGLAERIAVLHRDRTLLAGAALAARARALENTRTEWFRMRAAWTKSLLQEQSHAA